MPLTSTQIGTIGENLLINAVSAGRLAPFQPIADDDGLDVLFFDKLIGRAVAVQLKCRTGALFKPGTTERGNLVHFEVRKSTFNDARQAFLVAALLDEGLSRLAEAWFVPMADIPMIARGNGDKWILRASKGEKSADRFRPYRCQSVADLVQRIIARCAGGPASPAA